MIVSVTRADFKRAAGTVPKEAPRWMHREFAANFALQRTFPGTLEIRVDRGGIVVDGRRYVAPLVVHLCSRPYTFLLSLLSESKLRVRLHDLLSLLAVYPIAGERGSERREVGRE
jgi:hypothetical protein